MSSKLKFTALALAVIHPGAIEAKLQAYTPEIQTKLKEYLEQLSGFAGGLGALCGLLNADDLQALADKFIREPEKTPPSALQCWLNAQGEKQQITAHALARIAHLAQAESGA